MGNGGKTKTSDCANIEMLQKCLARFSTDMQAESVESPQTRIWIKSMAGQTLSVECAADETIAALKNKLEEVAAQQLENDWPAGRQRLIHLCNPATEDSCELADELTLMENGVGRDDVLHVVIEEQGARDFAFYQQVRVQLLKFSVQKIEQIDPGCLEFEPLSNFLNKSIIVNKSGELCGPMTTSTVAVHASSICALPQHRPSFWTAQMVHASKNFMAVGVIGDLSLETGWLTSTRSFSGWEGGTVFAFTCENGTRVRADNMVCQSGDAMLFRFEPKTSMLHMRHSRVGTTAVVQVASKPAYLHAYLSDSSHRIRIRESTISEAVEQMNRKH